MVTRMNIDSAAYRAAETLLRHNRATLVTGDKVRPRWLDDHRFWYSAGGTSVLVDPRAGTREPGFVPADPDAPGNPLEIPSPDKEHAVFLRGHDLWVRSLTDGREWALTSDGDADHEYGANSDYVARSPMLAKIGLPSLPPAVAWSPDSTRVVVDEERIQGIPVDHPDEPYQRVAPVGPLPRNP
jgi:dipeptidyl-peptidase 4